MNKEGSNNVIECRDLFKTYQEGQFKTPVLHGLNFKVKKGEQVAIVGSSGSGKSTLLHLLGTLDSPSQGQILINNQDIHQLNSKQQAKFRNEHLGFIYQFHHLLMEFSALENVAMPLMIRGESAKMASQKASELINKVGLDHRSKHLPSELSGGERQRVAIARALVTEPTLVLADEPTGNLDHANAENIYQLLKELNQTVNTSFVVVTHDTDLADKLDRSIRLIDGHLEKV
ncbi:MAG: lipoprotein-releasing system ATP-binding protein [Phenylobacterium sp.]|jgi:lipoprotein-releasing system ATP-binding protein